VSGPTIVLLLLFAGSFVVYCVLVFRVWRKGDAAGRTSKTWRAFVVFNPVAAWYSIRSDERRSPEQRDEHYKDLLSGPKTK